MKKLNICIKKQGFYIFTKIAYVFLKMNIFKTFRKTKKKITHLVI